MGWINVKDGLPQMAGSLMDEGEITQRVSVPVLAYIPGGGVEIAVYCEEDGWCDAKYGDYLQGVACWMPVPEVPHE